MAPWLTRYTARAAADAMHLTPDMVDGMYRLLCLSPPFRGWRLPPAEEVVFYAVPLTSKSGDYEFRRGKHVIRVNSAWCGSFAALARIVAHEMVHLHLQLRHPEDKSHHGARFMNAAALVCRHHHLDPKAF